MNVVIRNKLVVAIATLTVTACGGGGGGSAPAATPTVPNAAVGGIWTGITTLTDGTTFETAGFITETGELRFITDDGAQQVGTITASGNSFTASITEYAEAGSPATGTVSGTISARQTLTGSAQFAGETTSTFEYSYDSIYDRNSSLATIAGIYSDSDGAGYTETYTVDSDGTITGSDTEGCVFGGAISILNANYNMYRVNLTVSNCDTFDGSYTGLGALTDEGGDVNDTFVLSVTGTNYVISGFIPRT
ncbi:hypothetical protein [Alkalimarinus sediminis]|uniref:Lipoprotein n=1 Tax=Alkalimarinus sediminis TaxID=1632866 RepID=A0A9E8KQ52_9ALTE|nr:hypothetical protein [Alkalimarinus sediminis]UZW74272.1 hypothetical protein NNL22_14770 [Alkalimarinus sediminis]